MPNRPSNSSNNKLAFLIISFSLSLLTLFGGWVYSNLDTAVRALQQQMDERSQRLRAIEVRQDVIEKALDDIDRKLDLMLQQKGKREK